jgi:hypothetical protein
LWTSIIRSRTPSKDYKRSITAAIFPTELCSMLAGAVLYNALGEMDETAISRLLDKALR